MTASDVVLTDAVMLTTLHNRLRADGGEMRREKGAAGERGVTGPEKVLSPVTQTGRKQRSGCWSWITCYSVSSAPLIWLQAVTV